MVEIIGPPGVGKTAVYEALCSKWNPYASWIYMEALAWQRLRKGGFADYVLIQLHRYIGKLLNRSLPVDLGLRFSAANKALADQCWRLITESSTRADLRFRAAYFLFQDFCRYQAAMEEDKGRICLLHEGLLQKSFLLGTESTDEGNTLATYLGRVPQLQAIIYLNTEDHNIILKRLRSRRKTIAHHHGKSDEELRLDIVRWQHHLNAVVNHMGSQGTLFYCLDAAMPLAATVQKIEKILQHLQRPQSAVRAEKLVVTH